LNKKDSFGAVKVFVSKAIDRMERWIHKIAQETGVKLSLD